MAYFLGFSFSLAMLPKGEFVISKKDLSLSQVKELICQPKIKVVANPSHKATFESLKNKYGFDIKIPSEPVKVILKSGDGMLIIQLLGLPRLENSHQYTQEEIKKAKIRFMEIRITKI